MESPLKKVLAVVGNHFSDECGGYLATCPCCRASASGLEINTFASGDIILRCNEGCSKPDILSALSLVEQDLSVDSVDPSNGTSDLDNELASTSRPPRFRQHGTEQHYHYFDAAGEVVYRIVRSSSSKKRFNAYRNTDHGYVTGLGDTERVLYDLPGVLAAIERGDTVFVVEGEKDAERLIASGLAATTCAFGANSWQDSYAESLREAHVVILPDNDAPGDKYAEAVAGSLAGCAASVKVVRLPGLDESEDVSDFLDADGTIEDLTRLVDEANPLDNDSFDVDDDAKPDVALHELQQLHSASGARLGWLPFPTDVLPAPAAAYVRATAKAIGVDEAFVALHVLALLSAAIGASRVIRAKRSWEEAATLWTLTIAPSGSGKSPAMHAALRPLRALEAEAMDAYNHATAAWEHEKEQAAKEKRDPDPSMEPARQRRHSVGDTTVEAVVARHAENLHGLLIVRDEASAWLGSFDRYKRGASDSQTWIELHDGKPVRIDRKTGIETIAIRRPSVSLCGTIQTEILPSKLDSTLVNSGLVARLLMAEPPVAVRRWTEADVERSTSQAYERLIRRVYSSGGFTKQGDEPEVIVLSGVAKDLYKAFFDEHNEIISRLPDGPLRSAFAKLEARALRFALIFRVAALVRGNAEHDGTIDAETMAKAIVLTRWFRRETARVYVEHGLQKPVSDETERVASLLPSEFRHSDIMKLGFKHRKAYNVLNDLKERGYALPALDQNGLYINMHGAGNTEDKLSSALRDIDSSYRECTVQMLQFLHSRPQSDTDGITSSATNDSPEWPGDDGLAWEDDVSLDMPF